MDMKYGISSEASDFCCSRGCVIRFISCFGGIGSEVEYLIDFLYREVRIEYSLSVVGIRCHSGVIYEYIAVVYVCATQARAL